MAVANGYEKISTNGLVFMYDVADLVSYKGQPGTNTTAGVTRNGYNGYSLSTYSNGKLFESNGYSETVYIPTIGLREVQSVEIYNVYSGYGTDGNYNCCPSFFNYDNGWHSQLYSPNTTYTYQIIYKCASGYTHPNFMYHYEYDVSGNYITEYGLHDDTKREHLGDGWYHAWNTFTTNAAAHHGHTGLWYYNYNVRDKVSVAAISLVAGSTIRPAKQLIPSATTRSATQSLLPLVGNSTIDLSNVSFDSNGQIYFDGASNYISIPNTASYSNFTAEVVVYPTSNPGNYASAISTEYPGSNSTVNFAIGWHAGSWFGGFYNNSSGGWHEVIVGAPTLNTYHHFVLTYNGTQMVFYKNGISVGTLSTTDIAAGGNPIRIGRRWDTTDYFVGKIPVAKIYNKALTAAEVKQNYNKYKTRFNLS